MKQLFWIAIIALLLMMPGCSGCNKKEAATPAPAVKAPAVKAETEAAPEPAKKTEKKAETTKENDAPAMSPAESKEVVMRMVPKVVEKFKSDEFRAKLQEASKGRNMRELIQILQGAVSEVCESEGMEFEECMKIMNEHKEDKEVKEAMQQWKNSMMPMGQGQ